MAQHSNYWSCSPLADWIRGTKKLSAGTSEEWDEWTTAAQMKHNFRYWLAEEGLSYLQDFVTWPERKLNDIRYYINNRWISRSHSLTAHPRDIKPGQWQDVGNRFLPCLFNELVDFVEIELAWHHCAWDEEASKKYAVPWYRRGWLRWRTWRCPQAGIDNLNWQAQLRHDEDYCKDEPYYGQFTPQAVNAQEILSLYRWWTEVYRNRPDPYDASGWSAYCELSRLQNGGKLSFSADKSPKLKKAGELALKELQRIETEYEAEDEAMMIRLIKVRNSLWT
jgi:hypothetical protein